MSTDSQQQLDPALAEQQAAAATMMGQVWWPAFESELAKRGHALETDDQRKYAFELATRLDIAECAGVEVSGVPTAKEALELPRQSPDGDKFKAAFEALAAEVDPKLAELQKAGLAQQAIASPEVHQAARVLAPVL